MDKDDAIQDAAVALIEMRLRYDSAKCAHLTVEQRSRLMISWARLRLIDKYIPLYGRGRAYVPCEDLDQILVNRLAQRGELRLPDLEAEEIRAIVDHLPVAQREAIHALLFDCLTQPEAGKKLGVSQSTVCTNYHRGLNSLRLLLEEYNDRV